MELVVAADTGDLKEVKRLINEGADVNRNTVDALTFGRKYFIFTRLPSM